MPPIRSPGAEEIINNLFLAARILSIHPSIHPVLPPGVHTEPSNAGFRFDGSFNDTLPLRWDGMPLPAFLDESSNSIYLFPDQDKRRSIIVAVASSMGRVFAVGGSVPSGSLGGKEDPRVKHTHTMPHY
ncbi:hypothetical protein ZHAS_00012682 [Anopheles sinensis]|uniref:Uncharacterized protein n=1 Tax=Anopheles sinensis TaxID=74873 RepID=A0A084W3I3_ANOSI|nr:hypothetical protein ZHAS_00012682 [Anopheles sinensis]